MATQPSIHCKSFAGLLTGTVLCTQVLAYPTVPGPRDANSAHMGFSSYSQHVCKAPTEGMSPQYGLAPLIGLDPMRADATFLFELDRMLQESPANVIVSHPTDR